MLVAMFGQFVKANPKKINSLDQTIILCVCA